MHNTHRRAPFIRVRPGRSGDRNANIRSGNLPDALRHSPGTFFGNGAVCIQNIRIHMEHIRFDRCPVANHPAPVHCRSPGNGGKFFSNQTAGTALGGS